MNSRAVMIFSLLLVAGIIMSSCTPGSEEQTETAAPVVQTISATEFIDLRAAQPGTVIDVRTQEEYEAGHLMEAEQNLNWLDGEFEATMGSLDKDGTYYLYCRTGNRSSQAAEMMVQNGFTNVYNIGGFQELVDAGAEGSE